MTEENQNQTPPQDLPAPSASEEAGAPAQTGDNDYVGDPDISANAAEQVVETETQTEEVTEPNTQTEEAPTPTEPAPVEAGADAAPTEDSPTND